jgi:hypothetical protein
MSSEIKIGVLIQGPLSSIGRNGLTVNIPFFKLKIGDIVEYDSTSDVLATVDLCHKLSMIPCLVTQGLDCMRNIKIPCKTIDISEDYSYYKERYPARDKINHVGHNKYRQFNSLYRSLNFFESQNVTHILKIRTDSPVDLVEFKHYMAENYAGQKLVLPFIHKNKPYFFEDFFFLIKIQDVQALCENFLFGPEVAESVHLHFHIIFREFCCSIDEIKIPLYVNEDVLDRIRTYESLSKYVSVFHQKLFETMLYRGEKIHYLTSDSKLKSNDRVFHNDYELFLKRKININKTYPPACINKDYFASLAFKFQKKFIARKNIYYITYRNLHKFFFFPYLYIRSLALFIKYHHFFYK